MVEKVIVGCIFSYFLGSIPFSYLIAKKVKGVDIRIVGEGNVGGRNVWHVVGKKYGILAGLLDMMKGYSSYWLGIILGIRGEWIWLLGISTVVGHAYPIFLRGRGGKGAATAMGFLLAMVPQVVFISGLIMGILFIVSRSFHLAVGLGMGSLPLLSRFFLKKTWREVIIMLFFLLLLGIKRIIDEPYMRKIKEASGW